jgi:hypothetical protein
LQNCIGPESIRSAPVRFRLASGTVWPAALDYGNFPLMDNSALTLAAGAAMGFVLIVLIGGIVNLAISGKAARSRSNQLMRLRVVVQFVAVVLLMAGLWFKTRGS